MQYHTTPEQTEAYSQSGPPDSLADRHLRELAEGSGIPADVITERGYRTVVDRAELQRLGFADYQARVPALLIPIHGIDGSNSRYVLKPDHPRIEHRPDKPDRPIKYDYPAGQPNVLDVPPRSQAELLDPVVDLWVTEGWKKADALAAAGKCVIALGGVWNWAHRDAQGNRGVPIDDWESLLPTLDGRRVFICFDSDAASKPEVGLAERRLANFLRKHGAWVTIVRLPAQPDGSKNGVDDYLVRYGLDALDELVEGAVLATSDNVQALRTRVRELEQQLSAQATLLRNPGLTPTDKIVAIAVIFETGWRESTRASKPYSVNCGRLGEATALTRQTVSRSLEVLSSPEGGMFEKTLVRTRDVATGDFRNSIRLTPRHAGGVVAQLRVAAHLTPTRLARTRRSAHCPDHPDAEVRHVCTICGQVLGVQKLQERTFENDQSGTHHPSPSTYVPGSTSNFRNRSRPSRRWCEVHRRLYSGAELELGECLDCMESVAAS